MYDVTGWRAGYVAVGGGPVRGSLVWTSSDARSWLLLQPADVEGGGAMAAVIALPDRLVAVGRRLDAPVDTAAAWTSSDGTKWTMADGGSAFAGGQMAGATPGGPGVIAVGSVPGEDRGCVWLSADGASWERALDETGTLEHAFLWSVAAAARGSGYLAGGLRTGDAFAATIWTSQDGRRWTPAADLPNADGMQVRSIAVGGGRFVAVGERVGGGEAAAWTSPDALAWTSVTDESFSGASMVRVVAGGPGFVAVGTRQPDDAAIWTSLDGTVWDPVPPDIGLEDALLTSVVASPDRVVAVGAVQRRIPGGTTYETTPASWVSTAGG
jgi:hypothetical protein